MEEPSRLQSMGSLRVGHDWNDLAASGARPLASGLLFLGSISYSWKSSGVAWNDQTGLEEMLKGVHQHKASLVVIYTGPFHSAPWRQDYKGLDSFNWEQYIWLRQSSLGKVFKLHRHPFLYS